MPASLAAAPRCGIKPHLDKSSIPHHLESMQVTMEVAKLCMGATTTGPGMPLPPFQPIGTCSLQALSSPRHVLPTHTCPNAMIS